MLKTAKKAELKNNDTEIKKIRKQIVSNLMSKLSVKNKHEIPKIENNLNMGLVRMLLIAKN